MNKRLTRCSDALTKDKVHEPGRNKVDRSDLRRFKSRCSHCKLPIEKVFAGGWTKWYIGG